MWGFLLASALCLVPVQRGSEADPDAIEVWLCPVHRDVQTPDEGVCSICHRALEKRHLVSRWTCPMHAGIESEIEGSCPVCNMALVRTVREVEWACPGHPEVVSTAPGTCARDGTMLEPRSVPMAHGDHNPRHGGILFMAPDGFHHLEGTLGADRVFRLYLYDDFTRPIDASRLEARIGDRKLSSVPDGSHQSIGLEDIDGYPAEVTLFVGFEGQQHEDRFDFIFADRPSTTPSWAAETLVIPDDPARIAEEIGRRNEWIRDLIRVGGWTELYIPALEAKELALALGAVKGERMAVAVKKIVRAAWLLDMYGDLGNRPRVEAAHRLFEAGVSELTAIDER